MGQAGQLKLQAAMVEVALKRKNVITRRLLLIKARGRVLLSRHVCACMRTHPVLRCMHIQGWGVHLSACIVCTGAPGGGGGVGGRDAEKEKRHCCSGKVREVIRFLASVLSSRGVLIRKRLFFSPFDVYTLEQFRFREGKRFLIHYVCVRREDKPRLLLTPLRRARLEKDGRRGRRVCDGRAQKKRRPARACMLSFLLTAEK